MAPNPDRELAEARACIDRGDEPGAVKRLDRARRGYIKQRNAPGLEHLLVLADVLEAKDDRVRIGRDNLLYAVKQNLRQESRRQAQEQGRPWQDPYPDLQAPSEHTRIAVTRGVKFWIALGTGLATILLIAILALPGLYSTSGTYVTLRLVNNTRDPVRIRGCNDTECFSTWMHADLDPGLRTERDVPVDDVIDLFEVERGGHADECLPVRVHDGYELAGEQASVILVAKVADATQCPGSTVLPRPSRETGL